MSSDPLVRLVAEVLRAARGLAPTDALSDAKVETTAELVAFAVRQLASTDVHAPLGAPRRAAGKATCGCGAEAEFLCRDCGDVTCAACDCACAGGATD